MTHKRAAWATGTVSMTGTGECTITVALTADAVLVTRLDRAQSVKAVVDTLAERGRSDLL